ncbi:enoyl-CoA hydratase-related protein [Gordonia sp. NB41Y]|uniref:enoyl-CoA hydratase-related protein n=1 Tax=Gordonia sp. NB41Y TaxID=875808 RepID=UPI0006B167D9|nr:enoyl-CoA hydratase-related protein [Gordonia sp. NB41Y]EMP12442.2 enoyl-CoA hydratase [Gordonia sp. NB41Y]WLP91752.1 enoyl-CoA hydratase-related protein [Gordonia sp. NB41Y]
MTEPHTEPVVVLERDAEIAVLRLNRPDRLNACTLEMIDTLIGLFDVCDADDTIRAVVVTGTGRAFCAGADLESGGDTFAATADADTGAVPPDSGGRLALRIFRSTKPVIMAINGPAAGVGVTMTLPADVRIASDTAKFGFVFTRRGLVPEACSSWFLPRVVGIATAVEWTIGARMVTASEALSAGLVREVLPASAVRDRAIAIAREMTAGTSPVSVALTRAMMWRMLGAPDPQTAHHAESVAIFERGSSADVTEGVEAFLEKRAPSFTGRVSDGLPEIFG